MAPALDNYKQLKLPQLMPASRIHAQCKLRSCSNTATDLSLDTHSHQGDNWIYGCLALGSRSLTTEGRLCWILTSLSSTVFAKTTLLPTNLRNQVGKQPRSPWFVCWEIRQQSQLLADASSTTRRLNPEDAFPASQGRKGGRGFIY